MVDWRDGFRDIVNGWTAIDDFDDLTERIEQAAEWTKANGPLLPDERATIELMIKAQIVRGDPEFVRRVGLAMEYGLPDDDEEFGDNDNDNEPVPKLGPCCVCGTEDNVFNYMMLHRRSPTPGEGWGCVVCHLPNDGAVAVCCDKCVGLPLRFVCTGYMAERGRTPIDELTADVFDHDLAYHPERTPICIGCHKRPAEIDEYTDLETIGLMTPDEYVIDQEGTYNPVNGHFLCSACYIKAGMPSSPHGWIAP